MVTENPSFKRLYPGIPVSHTDCITQILDDHHFPRLANRVIVVLKRVLWMGLKFERCSWVHCQLWSGRSSAQTTRIKANNAPGPLYYRRASLVSCDLCWHRTLGAYPALSWPCTGPQHRRWNRTSRRVSRCLCWPATRAEQAQGDYFFMRSHQLWAFVISFPAVTANHAVYEQANPNKNRDYAG